MPRLNRWFALCAAAPLLLGATACASDGNQATPADRSSLPSTVASTGPDTQVGDALKPVPAGTYSVGRAERTYVDTSRKTPAHGGVPEAPTRTIKTVIFYPASGRPSEQASDSSAAPTDDATARSGPWPVIVFGHGSTRNADDYSKTLSWWASAGYVVVAPNFPLSTTGTAGGTAYGDYPEQTTDESFVLDSVLADSAAPLSLSTLVDHERIGLGGQSFGAITALGTIEAKCCADPRFKVATEFAGVWLPYPSKDELVSADKRAPVLFVHGDADPTVSYDGDRKFWERLAAPGGFLTLVDSGHDGGFFLGGTEPLDRLVAEATLAFYDHILKDDPTGMTRLKDLVAQAGPTVARFDPTPS